MDLCKDVYHKNFLSQLSYKVYHDNRDTLKLCVPPCSKSANDKRDLSCWHCKVNTPTQMTNYLFAI